LRRLPQHWDRVDPLSEARAGIAQNDHPVDPRGRCGLICINATNAADTGCSVSRFMGEAGPEGHVKYKAVIAFVLLAASFRPAAADLIGECRWHPWTDVRLRACAEIILNPSFGPDTRALAYLYRGEARTDAGAFQQAIADFSESIRLQPDNVPAIAGRARARFSARNFAGALGDYTEAIRLSPAAAHLYVARGHVHLSQGNLDASIRDLTEAIRLDPGSASAFNNRGLALRKKGDLDAAIQDYSTAIAINPAYALAYENRGYLQEARGQKNAAISDLQQALLLDPSLVGAQAALRRLGSGSAVADESNRRIRQGQALAEKYCSGCHAIGAQGRSTNSKAPEFRNLSRRYTLLTLREPITRGIAAPHDEMPQFVLSDGQIDTIVAYINSLSTPR
jgi:tetratricopeptide (TPR) repeat protein